MNPIQHKESNSYQYTHNKYQIKFQIILTQFPNHFNQIN